MILLISACQEARITDVNHQQHLAANLSEKQPWGLLQGVRESQTGEASQP
jgi:hypothetical protein